MQLRTQLVLFCFVILYGMEHCSSSWKMIIFRWVNGLDHFPQVFRQVKTWLIFELHAMTTVSNLVTCPIVFSFCFEVLVEMEEYSNIWEMIIFKYFCSLWLISSKFWVNLGADHTVFHKNYDRMFYNCISSGFYYALKSRSTERSAQTYEECSNLTIFSR